MIAFKKIKPKMTLWDVKHNTGMRGGLLGKSKYSIWPVYVIEVDEENRRVYASWNGNSPMWIGERHITQYRAKHPTTY